MDFDGRTVLIIVLVVLGCFGVGPCADEYSSGKGRSQTETAAPLEFEPGH